MKKSNNVDEDLDSLINDLNSSFGKGSIMMLDDESQVSDIKSFTTGSLNLDNCTGVGGFPRGRITEIWGNESSGKTTCVIHAIADCQSKGEVAAIVDVEHAFDKNYAKALGVDPSKLLISQPDTAEQALEIMERLVRSGKIGLVALDSIGGLVTEAEIDADLVDHKMAPLARVLSKSVKRITNPARETNTCVIFINQMRTDLGGYIVKDVPMGGNALKFYASLRIELRSQAKSKNTIEDGEHTKGMKKATIVKNKLAPPFKECEFTVKFGKGIDKDSEYLDDMVRRGIIDARGGGNYYIDGVSIGRGRANVVEFLEDNPDIILQHYS